MAANPSWFSLDDRVGTMALNLSCFLLSNGANPLAVMDVKLTVKRSQKVEETLSISEAKPFEPTWRAQQIDQ